MQMLHRTFWTTMLATTAALLFVTGRAPVAQQQSGDIVTTISSDQVGQQPRLAVPDFIALGSPPDAETIDAAKTIG
jgi:hypothetical protein